MIFGPTREMRFPPMHGDPAARPAFRPCLLPYAEGAGRGRDDDRKTAALRGA